MLTRARLRRWHVWLGWIIALPILFWVVSGLIMVARPIEDVRGTNLLRGPQPMRFSTPPRLPDLSGLQVAGVSLVPRAAGPRWVVTLADGTTRLADPVTGALLRPVSATEAMREVMSRYTRPARLVSATRTDPARPPLELRRPIAAWRVALDDGTNFYVDSSSGEIVARRSRWWRIYDFMFGLHIMDLKTREDTSNPLIITFAVIALLMSVLAMVLLPMTINRRKRRPIRRA